MKREPSLTGYFVGTEVEATAAKGLRTAFYSGSVSPAGLPHIFIALRSYVEHDGCEAIYLGANQSNVFQCGPTAVRALIDKLLELPTLKYITVDIPVHAVQAARKVLGTLPDRVLINVSFPYCSWLREHTAQTYVKIDDDVKDVQGPGVNVHALESLTQQDTTFTSWGEYSGDTQIGAKL